MGAPASVKHEAEASVWQRDAGAGGARGHGVTLSEAKSRRHDGAADSADLHDPVLQLSDCFGN